jgi:tryptophan-rich sensory protein
MMGPLLLALAVCIFAAALEGAFAGRGVKRRFAEIRLPWLSPPLPVWVAIGAAYYLICGVVLYRLFCLPPGVGRSAALALTSVVLLANAFWNYLFFRLRSLRLSFLAGAAYSLVGIMLLWVLFVVDRTAAWWFLPYTVYLIYANAWGYALLCANRRNASGSPEIPAA